MDDTDSVAASSRWIFTPTTTERGGEHSSSGFGPVVAFCFTINYAIGTGFLTIPYAFVQSGLILSIILLLISALLMDMSKNYVLESMARAENMVDVRMHWIKKDSPADEHTSLITKDVEGRDTGVGTTGAPSSPNGFTPPSTLALSVHRSSTDELSTLITELDHTPSTTTTDTSKDKLQAYLVRERKFELNMLCRIFLGKPGFYFYSMVYGLYGYGQLAAYTNVFSSAMAERFPIFNEEDVSISNYTMYAIILACVIVPVSCTEIKEQKYMQVFLCLCRFTMFASMIITAYWCAENNVVVLGPAEEIPMFRWEGISDTIPIIIFANMYQYAIPVLSQPVADRRQLARIFQAGSFTMNFFYGLVGIVLGLTFGSNINESANLNWANFTSLTGVYDADGNLISSALWTQIVATYIVCFPALDVLSAFPLQAISQGNNLLGLIFDKSIHEIEKQRYIVVLTRLTVTIPPLVTAIFVPELATLTSYAGMMGILVCLSTPALLFLFSKRIAIQKHFSVLTHYTSYASWDLLAWSMGGLGFGLFFFELVSQIM